MQSSFKHLNPRKHQVLIKQYFGPKKNTKPLLADAPLDSKLTLEGTKFPKTVSQKRPSSAHNLKHIPGPKLVSESISCPQNSVPTNAEKVAANSPDSETVTLWVHIHGPSLCGRVTLTGHGASLGLSFLICKMGQTQVLTPREPLRTQ